MTPYIIIGYSRSGTTAIHMALAGHPDIGVLVGEMRPEPFFTQGGAAFTGGYLSDKEQQTTHRRLFAAMTADAPVRGVKTACNSYKQARQIVSVLREHFVDMRVIHVIRSDEVAHFGSVYKSATTGIAHSWQGKGSTKKVRLPVLWFLHFLRGKRRLDAELRELEKSHKYIRVRQEDIGPVMFGYLFKFLDVAHVEVEPVAEKLLPDPREYITNYDRLRWWARWLDRPAVSFVVRAYGALKHG